MTENFAVFVLFMITLNSCYDEQIFHESQLRDRIGDGSIGFPDALPIRKGSPDIAYLGGDVFVLNTWLIKAMLKSQSGTIPHIPVMVYLWNPHAHIAMIYWWNSSAHGRHWELVSCLRKQSGSDGV